MNIAKENNRNHLLFSNSIYWLIVFLPYHCTFQNHFLDFSYYLQDENCDDWHTKLTLTFSNTNNLEIKCQIRWLKMIFKIELQTLGCLFIPKNQYISKILEMHKHFVKQRSNYEFPLHFVLIMYYPELTVMSTNKI